ncbi:MAG: hemolysin family protein [Terrimicrobiaceae bacterium]
MNLFDLGWQFLVILLLVAANGFFVAAEFAIVKIRASQLKPLLKTGDWRVPMALRAVNNLDACLSATQLGITLASLGLGWLGEPFLAHWLEPLLKDWGVDSERLRHSITFGIAFSTITFLHIVFGELAPKSLAIQRARSVSLWVAAPLIGFYYLFFPFIYVLNGTANMFLRWGGLQPASEGDHVFSADELEYVLSHSRHVHRGDALINKIMVRSLRLRDVAAQQVMLPRDQVVALWADKSVEENLKIAQGSGHSRYPVCEGTLDNVLGMVLVKEWLWQIQALGEKASFQPLIRPVLTFTQRTPLPTMIELFRSSRSHLAVVLGPDEAMAGIITFEDALEEIVGEIRDELDIEKGPIFEHTENSIVVDASLSMRELRAETGWNFEFPVKEDVERWILRNLGNCPRQNEEARIGEYLVTSLHTHAAGLRRARITRLSPEELQTLEDLEKEKAEEEAG